MGFAPIVGEANNLVFNEVHRTDCCLELADQDLNCAIWEVADFGIWRRQL